MKPMTSAKNTAKRKMKLKTVRKPRSLPQHEKPSMRHALGMFVWGVKELIMLQISPLCNLQAH